MSPTPSRALLALLSVPIALVVVACGGAGSDDAAKTGVAGGTSAPAAADPVRDATSNFDPAGATGSKAEAANAVIERSVISTGSLRLTSRHLSEVRQDAIGLANRLGGHVADEQSRSDTQGRLDRVDLTLRVPSASFEDALADLGALGTVRHREQSTEDVTTEVIDTKARVRSQRASVASMQQLLARATTIGQIISIENQLASRQADLDSLEQQQKYLADQTSMSTIQLTVMEPTGRKVVATKTRSGFLGGIQRGWNALGDSAVAVGTVVGAALPFAAVIALIGMPVWLAARRRRLPVPEVAP